MEFAKLFAPSLKDLFVQQLQGMILSGALPVGTQLPPERTLAEQMQVSRTVVNSGLAELSDQGFLEVRPRQGTCVADYRRRGNLDTLIAIMQYKGGVLGRDEIRSILEVRRALEHLAAERAILYASDGGGPWSGAGRGGRLRLPARAGLGGRKQHRTTDLLLLQTPGHRPVDPVLHPLRHPRPGAQHPDPVCPSSGPGPGGRRAVDRRIPGAGHQRDPADLRDGLTAPTCFTRFVPRHTMGVEGDRPICPDPSTIGRYKNG